MSLSKKIIAGAVCLSLAACGGGGGSDAGGSSTPAPTPTPPPAPTIYTGIIVDSAIANISYSTTSGQTGTTNDAGEFTYEESDQITFSIGNISFPITTASEVLTPFDLFDTKDISQQALVNFLRLIQSLDDDGDLSEGINLSSDMIAELNTLNLSIEDLALTDAEFATKTELDLVSRLQAQKHFSETLGAMDNLDTDGDSIQNNVDPDNDNDGYLNEEDAFPWDELEQFDFDSDGQGDNADTDDDNDGVPDVSDSNTQLIEVFGFANKITDNNIQVIEELNIIVLLDKADKSALFIDIQTGEEIDSLSFEYAPERVVYSSLTGRVYISLIHQEHSPYWWDEEQTGSIAVLDAESLATISTLSLQTDPYDFVITSNEKIIVSSGSGQWTRLHAYDLSTGLFLGSAGSIYHGTSLIYSPAKQLVYALEGSSLSLFDVTGESIDSLGNSYYGLDYSGHYWLSDDGNYLISSRGNLYSTLDFSLVKTILNVDESITDIVFDTEENTTNVILSNGTVRILNSTTLETIDEINVIGEIVHGYTQGNYAYYLTIVDNELVLVKQQHPCLDCGANIAPVADFSYTPINGDTSEEYIFDASASSDEKDSTTLKYRWDIDSDDVWDTHFLSSSEFKHKFHVPGEKYVRLQVKDNGGLTHTAIKSIDVAQGIDSGVEVTDSVAFVADFEIQDIATDRVNGYSYITDKQEKRLYVVNLSSGLTEKYFEFSFMPDGLYLQVETNKLYIAQLTKEHNSYNYDEERLGYISIMDVVQQTIVSTFEVDVSPYDLVVTSDDMLIVSSGSNQRSEIHAYDANSGAFFNKSNYGFQSKLTLPPNEEVFFSVNSANYISEFRKFDITNVGIDPVADSPYNNDYRVAGNIWATPDDEYVITRGGDLFRTSDMSFVRRVSSDDVSFEDIVFDEENNLFFALTSEESIEYFNSESYEEVGTLQGANQIEKIALYNDSILGFADNDTIITWEHPCPDCGANIAPTASFTITPTDGDTSDTFAVDASTSTDEEDALSELMFRWDFDNDNTWDTSFSTDPISETHYIISESKTIKLQVKDSHGAVHVAEQTFDVAQGVDQGYEITDSTVDELDFSVDDVATDTENGIQYILDSNDKKLYVFDLESGSTIRYFNFAFLPGKLHFNAASSRLYVTLLEKEAHTYDWSSERKGYVAVFDTTTKERIKTFSVKTLPYDIVATNDEKVIISPAYFSGAMVFVDAKTGEQHMYVDLYGNMKLELSHDDAYLFAREDYSHSSIYKYEVHDSSITSLNQRVNDTSSSHSNKMTITSDNKYLISDSGNIFRINDMSLVTNIASENESFRDVFIDSDQNLLFVLTSNGDIKYFNLTTFEEIATLDSGSDMQWLTIYGEEVISIASNEFLVRQGHPCLDCGANTSPVAAFSYDAATPDTSEAITFDASDSYDGEDLISQLVFKWDFDNDGTWDTSYSSEVTTQKKYVIAGNYTVVVLAKDTGGLTHEVSKQITIAQGSDLGTEITDSEAFVLGFQLTDIAIDHSNGMLYVTDKEDKKLYQVDLSSGETTRYFDFDFTPESLFFEPTTKKLFIAQLTKEHSSYYWDEDHEGYISLLDTTEKAINKTYRVDTDPYDLVVTETGTLVVSSGSGQWTDIFAFEAESGASINKTGIRQASKLALHPDGEYVFAADTDLSPSDIEKFEITDNGISSSGDSPYHGDHRMSGNIWTSPDGDYVITRGGDLFNTSDMTFVQNISSDGIAIEHLVFDEINNKLYTLESDEVIRKYSTQSYTADASDSSIPEPIKVLFYNEKLLVISKDGSKLKLTELAF